MTVLATSFKTWLPHQPTNSSDDLLGLLKSSPSGEFVTCLRKLPVHSERACESIVSAISRQETRLLLCCGMAEGRQRLNLEQFARNGSSRLSTTLPLAEVAASLPNTCISYDAGNFVCNETYYRLLHFTQNHRPQTQVLFVHVPVLTPENHPPLLDDFCSLISTLKLSL
ncbi:MAG: peptidase C15 [Synechococcus sp.]